MRSSWLASATNWRTRVSLALPGGERVGDVPEHPVERRADLADLGARVGVGVRNPFGRATSPRSRGSSATREAVAATRRSGRRASRTTTSPARTASNAPTMPTSEHRASQFAHGVLHRAHRQPDEGGDVVLAADGRHQIAARGAAEVDRGARGRRRAVLPAVAVCWAVSASVLPCGPDHVRAEVTDPVDHGDAERALAGAEVVEEDRGPRRRHRRRHRRRASAGRRCARSGGVGELVVELAGELAVQGDHGWRRRSAG